MSTELILVTGGTGGLGRRVVARLRRAGRNVRVLSRRILAAVSRVIFQPSRLASASSGKICRHNASASAMAWSATSSVP